MIKRMFDADRSKEDPGTRERRRKGIHPESLP
jgi:hypothetical protein